MLNNRRNPDAARRIKERRDREDAAPRLHAVVPRLLSLSLEVHESRDGHDIAEASHVRRVVVDRAPALFIIPCPEPGCHDGGHDITGSILSALHASRPRFESESSCDGELGNGHCGRVLRYVGVATYSE